MKMYIHQRKSRDGSFSERCPTIEDHVEQLRNHYAGVKAMTAEQKLAAIMESVGRAKVGPAPGADPCPFCGESDAKTYGTEGEEDWYVQCGHCSADGPMEANPFDAIVGWNERKVMV